VGTFHRHGSVRDLLGEAEQVCDRVAILQRGRLVHLLQMIKGSLIARPELAEALGGLLLSEIFGFCTFLEYGTTARAARTS
jgi:hypothetical protein